MALVSAKCPNCGGDIQLDDSKETGFCLHCGGKINVEQSIKTVKIDKSSDVDKLMKLAENAENSGNYAEAEEYATSVLEIDSTNYKAWFIKGKSAGWQSTLGNSRVSEMTNSFNEVLENIQNEDTNVIDEYRALMTINLLDIGRAMVDLAAEGLGDNIISSYDVENLKNQIDILLSEIIPYYMIMSNGLEGSEELNYDLLLNYCADKIYNTIISSWSREKSSYNGTKSDMNKYAWESLIEKNDLYAKAMTSAIVICSDEEKIDSIIAGYSQMRRDILNIPCYSYISYDYGGDGYMKYTGSQSSSLVSNVNAEITKITNIANNAKENIKQRKIEEKKKYYSSHPDELAKDLDEKRLLIEENKKSEKEQEEILKKEETELTKQQEELNNCGFFQFKEKSLQKQKIIDHEVVISNIKNKLKLIRSVIDEANEFIETYQNIDKAE